MTRLVIVGVLLVVGYVYVTIARWKKVRHLEELIRKGRELAGLGITYKPATEPPPDLDDAAKSLPAEMIVLGDMTEHPDGRPATGTVRWFRDAGGTLFGWVAMVAAQGRRIPVAMLMSHTEADAYLTRFSPAKGATPASAPWSHRHDAEYYAGLSSAIAAHRDRAPKAGCVRVTSMDELLAELRRIRAKSVAWRAAQPPDELLDKDLRAYLGAHYGMLGAKLARRLKAEVPRAKAL